MKHLKTLLGNGFKLGARGLLAAALAMAALGLAAPPASAATVVVNTTTDQSLGSCGSSCSLRDAVATAAPGDTVQIPAGHYVLSLGAMLIQKSLTLTGAGARTTIIDGNASSRIFNASGNINVELDDLSLVNGQSTPASSAGGAIAASGPNCLTPLVLTIRRCTFDNNQGANSGGALFLTTVALTIEDSTFSNNNAGVGGAILGQGATGSIVNSTFSGNTAADFAGGLEFFKDEHSGCAESLSLINNTIAANQAGPDQVGGIAIFDLDQLTLSNNIIAGNVGGDCSLSSPSLVTGHNLDSDNSCGFTGPGDLPGTNPLLGPLANNGGPTDTYALLTGSPALDAGNNSTCPATDQRGVTRPQGPACDIGAFEAVVSPQDQIAGLIAQVNALVTAGALTPSNAKPLLNTLENAAKHLDKGQVAQTCKELGDFIQKVNGDIQTGKLTAANGQALIDAANAIRANLGC